MVGSDRICGVVGEFGGVSLGDSRLDARLVRIVELSAASPSASFPDQMHSDAELEGLYRFLANDRVTIEKLLAGHLEQTKKRIGQRPVVRVLHDTTRLRFDGDREGLGVLQRGARGFLAHMALAVAADEDREPLGVLGLRAYVHADASGGESLTPKEIYDAEQARPRDERESSRWEKLAAEVTQLLPDGVRAVHIMDQEADDFALIAGLQASAMSYVIRGASSRVVFQGRHGKKTVTLLDLLESSEANVFRTVRLSARSKAQARTRRHAERIERDAELQLKWGAVTLPRPERSRTDTRELNVNAVFVFEPNPPPGTEPVEWMLLTSEPVNGFEDAVAIVDHYRARWMIEEYFKALKTGCSIEKRQLTCFDGLVRALALAAPIAWKLLALRHWSRVNPSKPAGEAYEPSQIELLTIMLAQRAYALPKRATVRDVMLGIAKLGGHIKNNGDPGWQVLGRGMLRFEDAHEIWRMALEM